MVYTSAHTLVTHIGPAVQPPTFPTTKPPNHQTTKPPNHPPLPPCRVCPRLRVYPRGHGAEPAAWAKERVLCLQQGLRKDRRHLRRRAVRQGYGVTPLPSLQFSILLHPRDPPPRHQQHRYQRHDHTLFLPMVVVGWGAMGHAPLGPRVLFAVSLAQCPDWVAARGPALCWCACWGGGGDGAGLRSGFGMMG